VASFFPDTVHVWPLYLALRHYTSLLTGTAGDWRPVSQGMVASRPEDKGMAEQLCRN